MMKNNCLMITKMIVSVSCALAIAGCASPRQVSTVSSFDAGEAKRLLQPGTNTIRGSALIRQRGGGVVSCAGNEVNLIPATAYASERITAIYGSQERGYASYGLGSRIPVFKDEPPQYRELWGRTVCDAQGYFKFDRVADGSFFVTTAVVWKIDDYFNQGGALMQRVSVRGGETKEIVLAP